MPDASPFPPQPPAGPLRCLVASSQYEDLVSIPPLLSTLGHQTDIARSAESMLNAIFDQPRDVLLLDLPLLAPEPAQYVEAIRQHTSTQGQIIRLIAIKDADPLDASKAAAEPGFDAVLLRPINSPRLLAALCTRIAPPAADAPLPVDLVLLRSDLDGDDPLLHHLASVLVKDFPRVLETLQLAFANNDTQQVARTAHGLRGALGNFRAGPSFVIASDLERLAAEGSLDAAREQLPLLAAELKKLESFVLELVAPRA